MHLSTSVLCASTILAGAATAWAQNSAPKGDAPVIKDSPLGAFALATMPAGGDKDIVAEIAASTSNSGEGLDITVNINGGTQRVGGNFMYHIHEKEVGSDGNCTAAGAHLDPLGRGEDPACDPKSPASCQIGDLSGKYGNCQTIPGCSLNFTDKYLSLSPSSNAFIGNKAFVIHYANKTRIACANFVVGAKSSSSSSSSSASTSSGSATYPSVTVPIAPGSPTPTVLPNGSTTTRPASAGAPSATASGAASPVRAEGVASFGALISGLLYAMFL